MGSVPRGLCCWCGVIPFLYLFRYDGCIHTVHRRMTSFTAAPRTPFYLYTHYQGHSTTPQIKPMNQATTAYPVDKGAKVHLQTNVRGYRPCRVSNQRAGRRFREGKIVRTRHHIGRPVQSEGTRPLTPPLTWQYIKERPGFQYKPEHAQGFEQYINSKDAPQK